MDPQKLGPGWSHALEPVRQDLVALESQIHAMRSAGRDVLPSRDDVLAAFSTNFYDVKVLVLGQDPYPTPGVANGHAFSTAPGAALPASLRNISIELSDDLGCPPLTCGDLSGWVRQGVCLLNRVLTTDAGEPDSHRSLGWQAVTDQAIRALVARRRPLVAILWGRRAQTVAPLLGDTPVIQSAHPSPLSARRGFFGSHPFSRANQALERQGASPINWCL